MSVTDHHFRREDREVTWRRIARHIDEHPGDLAIALDNLDRWESLGRVHPGPIHEWRGRILAARESQEHMRALIDFLAQLHATGHIDAASVRCRIESLEIPIELAFLPTSGTP